MKPVLALTNIHKSFGALDVLRGVNLTAHQGETVALIGSSGSGKSTLLRCCNLLEVPQQGEIAFQDEPISWRGTGDSRRPADDAQVRRIRGNLSMVFQQFNLWSHMTIAENVMEAPIQVTGLTKAAAEERAHATLARVGIEEKANNYPNQLSGGQQQRAAIARALAMEPAAMLFDEPTSALDPELEGEVLKVIRSLADEGRTMLLVTHDMKFAKDVANSVIFLHQGVIEEQGSPAELFGNPKSKRLQQFLAATAD